MHWCDTVNQPHAETLMVYVCVYSTKTTLCSCCVWLMHRDTLPIMSEEINIPLSFISTLFISSVALWLTFPTPWLLHLALCAAVEGIMRLCVTSRFSRSFTTKFARQRSRDRRGSLLVTLLHKQSSWFHPQLPPPAGLSLFIHSSGTKMKHCALVYTQNGISPLFPSQGP